MLCISSAAVLQEKEEQVSAALQEVTSALSERTQHEQGFMERYVASLDNNQQLLEEQLISNAVEYNSLKDKSAPCLPLPPLFWLPMLLQTSLSMPQSIKLT